MKKSVLVLLVVALVRGRRGSAGVPDRALRVPPRQAGRGRGRLRRGARAASTSVIAKSPTDPVLLLRARHDPHRRRPRRSSRDRAARGRSRRIPTSTTPSASSAGMLLDRAAATARRSKRRWRSAGRVQGQSRRSLTGIAVSQIYSSPSGAGRCRARALRARRARARSARAQLQLRAGADEARARQRVEAVSRARRGRSIRRSVPAINAAVDIYQQENEWAKAADVAAAAHRRGSDEPRAAAAAGVLLPARRRLGERARALQARSSPPIRRTRARSSISPSR